MVNGNSVSTTSLDTLHWGTADFNSGGTITTSVALLANSLNFGGATQVTLSGTGTITLGNGTAGAGGITKTGSGEARIQTHIILNNSQTWANDAAGSITFDHSGNRTLDLDSHNLTINNVGAVRINNSNATFESLKGSGNLLINGASPAATFGLRGNNTNFTGDITLNGGSFIWGNPDALANVGNITITAGVFESRWQDLMNRTLGTGDGQIRITGGASGFGNNNGSSTVRLNNSNSYEVVWGDANEADNENATGHFNPSTFLLNSQHAQDNLTAAFTFDNPLDLNGSDRTISADGGVSGTMRATMARTISNSRGESSPAGLTKEGGGILILNAANTYNGGTTINGGTLRFTTLASMPDTGNVTVNDGTSIGVNLGTAATVWGVGTSGTGTLGGLLAGVGTSEQTVTYNGNVRLNLEVVASVTYSGDIADIGDSLGLVKSGSGVLTLAGNNSYSGGTRILTNLTLTGDNTTSGDTELVAGTLAIGHNNALGSGKLIISGGNFRAIDGDRVIANAVDLIGTANPWDTNNLQINGNLTNSGGNRTLNNTMSEAAVFTLAGQVNLSESNTARTLTIGGTGDTFVSGNIVNGGNGAGGLTKSGAGTLTLSGNNGYTGTTTVSAGTLIINGDQSLATGNVAVNNTSTLGGSGTIGGNVTVAAGAKLAPGDSVGTLSLGGNLTLSAMAGGAGLINLELGSIAASDKIAVTGTLTIGTDLLGFSDFNFTPLDGLQNGTYKLITSGGAPVGSLDAIDLTGPVGTGSGTLQISDGGSGNDLELVVSGLGDSGDPYADWSGGADFDGDANNDGVSNGLAFLLGASGPNDSALGLLPTVTETSGGLVLNFSMLDAAARGTATLSVEHSSDLGIGDPWEAALVPDADDTVNDVVFAVSGSGPLDVQATIPSGKAVGGKLFGRLKAVKP